VVPCGIKYPAFYCKFSGTPPIFITWKSQLRLDIGTSRDIYRRHCEDKIISFGADFFTYTRLRGEKEFHFPVETIDYLFGINAGFKKSKPDSEYGFRFRLSHISAHL
jgi:hypothetical protein